MTPSRSRCTVELRAIRETNRMQIGTDMVAAAGPRREPIDRVLGAIGAVLLIAVLAAAAFLAYSVVQGRSIELGATPSARLIDDLHAQIEESPNDPALRVRLGEAYAASGNFGKAVEELNVALELDPEHTGAHLVLGMVAMMEKDYVKADTFFLKIVDITEGSEFENVKSHRELALYYLGESALSTARYEEAVGYFKGAIRINRGSAQSYFGLGAAFKGMGEYDAALENLEIALAFDPKYPEAHYEMGQIYLAQDDRINAAVHFAEAARLVPDNDLPAEALASLGSVDDWESRAREALDAGDLEGALEAALVTRALVQDDPTYIVLHGEVLEAMGNREDALDVYAEVLALDPDNPEANSALERLETQ